MLRSEPESWSISAAHDTGRLSRRPGTAVEAGKSKVQVASEDLSLLNGGFSASSVAGGRRGWLASSSLFYQGSVFMIFSHLKGNTRSYYCTGKLGCNVCIFREHKH